ncbi:HtaA domain-containing protein [Corynebacterium aquilae]|uniref:Htaa domain-containing protein n=1 Tax=Corynebacterium aquilae DSM 44791 TaxID=1431546 RepID=A0A1L7CE68_9CORY|nr:HtaA domain-containing protein [Corynebacterium aquilae]APT84125.1 hypothetical protein CAQU_02505 [Corynebacterium aquilae DSM 44791]
MRMRPAIVALGSGLALSASLITAPVAMADEQKNTCTDVSQVQTTKTTLLWNFKDSFLSHIQTQFADGTVTATEGATFNAPKGPVTYPGKNPAGSYWNTPGNELDFAGNLHLTAYKGLGPGGGLGMDTNIHDLKLKITSETTGEILGSYQVRGWTGKKVDANADGKDAVIAKVTFDAPFDKAAKAQSIKMKVIADKGAKDLSAGRYEPGEDELSEAVLQVENSGDCLAPAQGHIKPVWEESSSDSSAEMRHKGVSSSDPNKQNTNSVNGSSVGVALGLAGLVGVIAFIVSQMGAVAGLPAVQLPPLPAVQLPPLPAELQALLPR